MSDKQCPWCRMKHVGPVKPRRRNTAYVHDQENWMTSCVYCILEDDLYHAYNWADYYNSSGAGGYSHYTDFLINRTPWRTK